MSRQLAGKRIRFLRICFINGVGHFRHQGWNLRSCCCRRFCDGVGLRFAGRSSAGVGCYGATGRERFTAIYCSVAAGLSFIRSGIIGRRCFAVSVRFFCRIIRCRFGSSELRLIIGRCSSVCVLRVGVRIVLRHHICCFPFKKVLSGLLRSRCIFTDIRRAA